MTSTSHYESPLGILTLAATDNGLCGLWFEGQRHCRRGLEGETTVQETPILQQAIWWLDIYFSGREPDFCPPLQPSGTGFQQTVWQALTDVPYGQTRTYKEIAEETARRLGCPRMSPRAVGNAVARNPISILIPCHRIVGSDRKLTGYAGGISRKQTLLELEHIPYYIQQNAYEIVPNLPVRL